MRASIILPAVLAAAPALVTAAGTLGFSLGAKMPDGSCKKRADYEADFVEIQKDTNSKLVRIYAADQCDTAKEILPAAKAEGFQVVLGIWADYEESYAADKKAIAKYAPDYKDQVYAVTVGSESMYRGNFTGEELKDLIVKFKEDVPGFKVGTADTWNRFADGTGDAFLPEVDLVLCNAFSYWQGQAIEDATEGFFDDIQQAFEHVQSINPSVELWVGETGWPSDGSSYQDAEPGMDNAEKFYSRAVCGMIDWGFNVFFFEAFDEPWKPVSIGEDGNGADERHWGAMEEDRSPKYSLKC